MALRQIGQIAIVQDLLHGHWDCCASKRNEPSSDGKHEKDACLYLGAGQAKHTILWFAKGARLDDERPTYRFSLDHVDQKILRPY